MTIKVSIKQADGTHAVALCQDYDANVGEDGTMSIILFADDNRKEMSHFFAEVITLVVHHLEDNEALS